MADKRNTITAVVLHFMKTKLKEPGLHRFEETLAHALWGLREISLDNGGHLQATKILTMNSFKSIEMPIGYVDWVSIGVLSGNTIQFISKSEGQISLHSKPYLADINAKPAELSFSGVLNSTDKFFVVDEAFKQIKFSSAVNTGKAYLDYISDGFNADQETEVHPYMQDYVIKYLTHEMIPSSVSGPELYHAEAKVRARNSGLDEETTLAIFRDTIPYIYGGI